MASRRARRGLARLREIWSSGAPGVVLAGAAGVGKTTLARALGDATGAPVTWLVGTLSAASIPFGALAHLLPTDAAAGRTESLHHFARALMSRDGRGVVVVDDAHLLDDGSAVVVHHLATGGEPFLVVTLRAGEPAPDPVVSLWSERILERIDLQPLSADEVGRLAEATLGGPVDAMTRLDLWKITAGNALFLRELIEWSVECGALANAGGRWSWAAPPPPGRRLIEIVEARLAGLGASERDVLDLVAWGEPVGIRLLEQTAGAGAVEAVERRGLVVAEREGRRVVLRMSHPLCAEVLRATAPESRARRIKRVLAEGIESAGARRTDDLLRSAVWRIDAGLETEARTLVAAARRAEVAFDHALTERLSRAACDAGAGFEALHLLTEAVAAQGRLDEADALARSLRDAAADDAERVRASYAAAGIAFMAAPGAAAARAIADAARDTVRDGAADDELVALQATLTFAAGRPADVVRRSRSLLDRRGADERAVVRALVVCVPSLAMIGDVDGARAGVVRGREIAPRCVDDVPYGPYMLAVGEAFAHGLAGDPRTGRALAEETAERALHDGNPEARAMACVAAAECALLEGRPATALRFASDAADFYRRSDPVARLPRALAHLAHAAALLGDAGAAREALAEASGTRAVDVRIIDVHLARAETWTAFASGDRTRAPQIALRAAETGLELGQTIPAALCWHDAVRLGDPAAAVRRLDAAVQALPGHPLLGLLAAFGAARGAGDAAALGHCAERFAAAGMLLDASWAASAASAAYGNAYPAASQRWSVRAAELARDCEGARRPSEASVAGLLTPRELEVAALAARGLSNREIGALLGVAVRTVENHLHTAYAKLGVDGRRGLRAALG